MRDRWLQLADRLGIASADAWFTRIAQHYAEPVRAYHNMEHIGDCLATLDARRSLAVAPDSCELALWLHDVIYDPMAKDNEARSALVASELCAEASRTAPLAAAVAEIILGTRHLAAPLQGDAALVADIDLSILASLPDRYGHYCRQIRAEYPSVPDEKFKAGRAAFLRGMLDRPRLFHTDHFHAACDGAARENLASELRAIA
jgi:predicted metal-dependent HD superfamily phosphohydrolase